MAIITLTTDFGIADGYVGTMKGVILSIAPDVRLVDLSHDVAPQNVRQAAYVLSRAAPYFPAGTVHLAVVDPGVGSSRRPLAVTTPRAAFVGPDNGLFTFALAEPDAQAWVLHEPAYWLAEPSRTFHGRDIFAPVAAHLVRGVAASAVGRPIADPVTLPLQRPERTGNRLITGHVIHVDRFGNLVSDIPGAWVSEGRWQCVIAGGRSFGVHAAYTDVPTGEPVALVGSSGTVEVAVRDGRASQQLGLGVDDPIRLRLI